MFMNLVEFQFKEVKDISFQVPDWFFELDVFGKRCLLKKYHEFSILESNDERYYIPNIILADIGEEVPPPSFI